MMQTFASFTLLALLSSPVVAQSAAAAPAAAAPAKTFTFEAADVHPSPHRTLIFGGPGSLHGDRYVVHQATMLDLIAEAYGLDSSNVQGGPSWLEMDRFEITAKTSPTTTQTAQKLMLKSLLADRFALVAHTGMAPMPAYVLSVPAGGKPKMKESDGSGDATCVPDPQPQNRVPGAPVYIVVHCHNLTMATFADTVHRMAGGYLTKPVVDATGLEGAWDFDIKWSPAGPMLKAAGADGISIFDAVDKELGLKLELQTAPRPVLIVDSVNEKPTPNAPDIATVLPPPPPPTFEVATIKPSDPDAKGGGSGINGGQVDLRGIPLKFLISLAWDLNLGDPDAMVGAPKWLDTDKIDILAKVSSADVVKAGPVRPSVDIDDLRDMLKALVAERFQMKYHMEDRPQMTYTLIAVDPKLRKADPTSRSKCFEGPGPDGKDPRIANPVMNRLLTCQNMTMAQIGDQFQRVANGFIHNTVLDGTGIPGGWDFTLSFSSIGLVQGGSPGGTAAPGGSGDAASGEASEPNGAVSLFDAVSKQLGLKLEKQKRPVPVLVIDHIEEKPTEN